MDVGGATVHAVVGGDGPAVMLLHGFPETWYTWRDVMTTLGRSHRVIAPDLPGVGCSSLAGRYDADSMARAMHEVVASEGRDRVAVLGHDTGGWVAYSYARQYRDEVSHLILSGATIPGSVSRNYSISANQAGAFRTWPSSSRTSCRRR